MQTVKALYESQFSCFSHLSATDKKGQIATVEYIQRMAALTNTNITDVNLFDVFGNGNQKDRLIVSKSDINKRLFDLGNAPVKSRELTIDEQAILKHLAERQQLNMRTRVTQLREQIRSNYSYADSHYTQYMTYVRKANENNLEIRRLENRTSFDLIEDVRKVMTSTFWQPEENPTSSIICFSTRDDVILAHKNPAAGIDHRVNLGRFKANFDVDRVAMTVTAYRNNLSCMGGFYHPYINTNGRICWGNATDSATRMIAEMKFSEVMELLAGLLTTYSPDATPYVSLEVFQEESNRIGEQVRRPLRTEAEESADNCNNCERHIDNCECYYCDHCSESYTERCDEHWCSVCQSYDRGDCGCCSSCDRMSDDCECCGNCGSDDRDECGCCQDCDRSARRIREAGHAQYCSRREAQETPETEETA